MQNSNRFFVLAKSFFIVFLFFTFLTVIPRDILSHLIQDNFTIFGKRVSRVESHYVLGKILQMSWDILVSTWHECVGATSERIAATVFGASSHSSRTRALAPVAVKVRRTYDGRSGSSAIARGPWAYAARPRGAASRAVNFALT